MCRLYILVHEAGWCCWIPAPAWVGSNPPIRQARDREYRTLSTTEASLHGR